MGFTKYGSILLAIMLFAGCASAPPPPPAPPKKYCADGREFPKWVFMGGAAIPEDAGKVFYGKGEASNIKNHSLLATTADNRAIAEIAKTFKVNVQSLMRDYMASTSAADKESSEQHVENVQKTVVNESLSGVMISDRCEDETKGIFYSLAKLDVNAFTGAIEKHKELGKKMRDYVKANAESAFEKLEKETEKTAPKE
ncbi:MAG: LPP20 family lipoprotein [Nitrospinae bacterium]|nr:LPP20 family lipoprotein [Nitrospinota bacterium]